MFNNVVGEECVFYKWLEVELKVYGNDFGDFIGEVDVEVGYIVLLFE